MITADIQKLLSGFSDRELRKWCLETAISQVNSARLKLIGVGYESVQDLKKSHMEIACAYYQFLTGGEAKSAGKRDCAEGKADIAYPTLSASKLLSARDLKIYPACFNKKMAEHGFMVSKPASTGYIYKELTEKGLEFGENKNSKFPNTPSQPIYYVDKFDELLDILGITNNKKK